MRNFGNILWGIVFIIIGVILGGNAIGITNINIFFDGWWTLFIIIPCFIELFKEREKTANIIGILIGGLLLLSCQNILSLKMVCKLAFPVILIMIGLSFVFQNVFNKKINQEIKKMNNTRSKDNSYYAVFSGQDIKFDGEKFNGGDLIAVFGGIKCDLKNSIIDKDVLINVNSIFGGTEIYIPDNVNVKIKSSSVFGGVDEKKKNKLENDESHTIYINATCVFGGVEVK